MTNVKSKQPGTTHYVLERKEGSFLEYTRSSKFNIQVQGLNIVKKNLCTMVHVFGTNSWREIPQVPSYPISSKAVFANGCLHWLPSYSDIKTGDGGRDVIWFDVNKGEFGLIERPKRMCDKWRCYSCTFDELVDLNGEVGCVEFWLLNHKKE
ncbi:hypothetical protein Tco_0992913 [Tanacetum coccineum]|uniref:F-box associated beta-propeller type 3 domain-containing protein n=1 Tax=Tanacetum coccineum TaxID=301880 RepID=A0ABQ5F4L0_9ASTR